MNLWAKRLRQLLVLAVALFFFSCEDDNSIIGYRNPNKKFNVAYIEFPLESSVVMIDSIITDNATGAGAVTGGIYIDPVMGTVRAQPYLQIFPASSSKLDATSVFDSITMQLRLNFYAYGFTGDQTITFSVQPLVEKLTYENARRYYFNSEVPTSFENIGVISTTVDYDSLVADASGKSAKDTILIQGRLSDDYGDILFSVAKNDPDTALSYMSRFHDYIKGLTIVPQESNGIIGFDIGSSFSKVTLHYHTTETSGAVKDTLERAFYFNHPQFVNSSFTNFSVDRSMSELAGLQPYQEFDASARYVQSGSPLVAKLDLANFYNFADTVENIIINSAELVIDDVASPDGIPVHQFLRLRIMNDQSRFTTISNETDSVEMRKYYVASDNRFYNVYADRPETSVSPATIAYDDDSGKLSGFFTLFAQSLFNNKNDDEGINEKRIRYLALYPQSPDVSRSATRTIFDRSKVRLRIYYTRPSNLNQ